MNDIIQSKKEKSEPASHQTKISGKRRTLIKGAIGAAPAVLTLRSGAAFALNSAEMCVATDNSRAFGQNPEVLIAPADLDNDIWLRKLVYCRTLTQNGDPSNTFDVYNEVTDATSGWRHEEFGDGGSNTSRTFDVSGGNMKETGTSSPTYNYTASAECYVLVIMDGTGYPVDIGKAVPVGDTLPYITNSCWCSATPGKDVNDLI